MSLLKALPIEELTAARVWSHLTPAVREEAATALYAQASADAPARQAAHLAIARALRFREASVRKLPAEKKAGYLAKMIHLDEMLASGLLQSLHLERRSELLSAFLDALGIAHSKGSIDENASLEGIDAARLEPAVEKLYAGFPADQVELYLMSLLAVDRETWAAVAPILARKTASA